MFFVLLSGSTIRNVSRNSFKSTRPSLLISIIRQISDNCSSVILHGMCSFIKLQASASSSKLMYPELSLSIIRKIASKLLLFRYNVSTTVLAPWTLYNQVNVNNLRPFTAHEHKYIETTAFNIESRLVLHHFGVGIDGHQLLFEQPPWNLQSGALF